MLKVVKVLAKQQEENNYEKAPVMQQEDYFLLAAENSCVMLVNCYYSNYCRYCYNLYADEGLGLRYSHYHYCYTNDVGVLELRYRYYRWHYSFGEGAKGQVKRHRLLLQNVADHDRLLVHYYLVAEFVVVVVMDTTDCFVVRVEGFVMAEQFAVRADYYAPELVAAQAVQIVNEGYVA